jgi:hypothetical protein
MQLKQSEITMINQLERSLPALRIMRYVSLVMFGVAIVAYLFGDAPSDIVSMMGLICVVIMGVCCTVPRDLVNLLRKVRADSEAS